MKKASTETTRQSGTIPSVSNQRLVAASKRARESYTRVKRFAEHLSEELDHLTSPNGIPITELDPEDSMVVAVEKVITTVKSTVPPPLRAAMAEGVTPSRAATRQGIAPIAAPIRKPTGG
jgi:hypothetical protein